MPPAAAAAAPASPPSALTLPNPALRPQVPLSSFSYLFSELVQYSQARAATVGDLERRLEDAGAGVGERLLEVLATRERAGRRETRLLDALKFVHTTFWRYMFGRQARDLEQSNTVRRGAARLVVSPRANFGGFTSARPRHPISPPPTITTHPPPTHHTHTQAPDEFMISDADLFPTRFAAAPKELGALNLNAFVAGVARGALCAAGFPCRATAHWVAGEGGARPRVTTILLKFEPAVLERERRLAAGG